MLFRIRGFCSGGVNVQTWSVPLRVFSILKRELPDVSPVDYMKHLNRLSEQARYELRDIVGYGWCGLEDAIGHIFIKQRPGTSEILLKYMPTVQYGRMWNPFYKQCRGTVIDMDKMVAWHSYDKWFNVSEMPETDEQLLIDLSHTEKYKAMNKWDGSLILFYFNNGKWNTCTNGSFESEQAQWAISFAKQQGILDTLDPLYTHMYEAIYPGNHIVVDYGNIYRLVPLARRNMMTGVLELPTNTDVLYENKTFEQILSERDIHKATEKEGWIIRFDSGLMVKIKCTDYVRVHKLKDQITPEGVFNMIQSETLDDVYANVPDDIKRELDEIVARYVQWERDLRRTVESIQVDDVTDNKATYRVVSGIFDNGTFEQWYALKYIRGQIDRQHSPLMYVKTFDKVAHLFDSIDTAHVTVV